jgi:iron(III) transport system substrate-binding protein
MVGIVPKTQWGSGPRGTKELLTGRLSDVVRHTLSYWATIAIVLQMLHQLKPILFAFGLLATACSSGSSGTGEMLTGPAANIYGGECVEQDGSDVTIYSGRAENLMEPVFAAFECETGIRLKVRYASNTDLALSMNEEGDRTPADVFLSSSPGPVGFLANSDLLGNIDDDVLELVDEQNRSANGNWVGFSGRKRVLVYNVDEVSADQLPNSIFDLTDPAYEGQVAIPATNGSFADWFTVFRQESGNDVATQWLDDMVANGAKPYPNNRSIVEAASRGEIHMGLVNHYYNYQEAAAAGDDHRAANHDLADDDIGSLLIVTAATVTAASDNPEAANELVGYLLSEGVQRYYSEVTLEYPLAAGVEPAAVLPPLSDVDRSSVNFDDLGDEFEKTNAIIEASGILSQ